MLCTGAGDARDNDRLAGGVAREVAVGLLGDRVQVRRAGGRPAADVLLSFRVGIGVRVRFRVRFRVMATGLTLNLTNANLLHRTLPTE